MYIVMIILIVFASLLMCGIVLIQESKGGGLASSFSSSNQIMGVRKTTDFLEKGTWFLAGFMVLCSIVCAYVIPEPKSADSAILNEVPATPAPSANPAAGGAQLPGNTNTATPAQNNTNAAGKSQPAENAPLKAPAAPAR